MTRRDFDPHADGTSEDDWLASPLSATQWLSAPGRGDVVVVVAAHPDDESLGAGGLISMAAACGATVRVVVATDGEASHPSSPTHDRVRLATVRRKELRTAVGELAPGVEPILLGLPDGALSNNCDALAYLLEPHLADASHVVTTWAGDGHPDHETCAVVCQRLTAARRNVTCWQFPIWAWHLADPACDELPWSRLARLRLTPTAREAKQVAVDAYRSQHSPLSPAIGDEAILPAQVLTHFSRNFETFVIGAPAGDPVYFDALYDEADDPWGLADRFYEQRKRELILASLPRRSFACAFEPGCATGELTARLAERCAEVLAWDAAAAAVARARSGAPQNVRVERGRIPDEWPAGSFDLIVLSEVGYYCTDLDALVRRVRSSLTADGVVVACHWRHAALHHPATAEEVHGAVDAGLQDVAARLVRHEEADFLLDVWSADLRSVAQAEGIVP